MPLAAKASRITSSWTSSMAHKGARGGGGGVGVDRGGGRAGQAHANPWWGGGSREAYSPRWADVKAARCCCCRAVEWQRMCRHYLPATSALSLSGMSASKLRGACGVRSLLRLDALRTCVLLMAYCALLRAHKACVLVHAAACPPCKRMGRTGRTACPAVPAVRCGVGPSSSKAGMPSGPSARDGPDGICTGLPHADPRDGTWKREGEKNARKEEEAPFNLLGPCSLQA